MTIKTNIKTSGSWNAGDPDRPQWGFGTRQVAKYEYTDEKNRHLFFICKGTNADGEKVFRTQHINPLGYSERFESNELADILSGMGEAQPVPYRLHELVSSNAHEPVFIVEGEKDVETLRSLDLTATCNPFGALKWKDSFSQWLKDRDVVILPDNDERGEAHAKQVLQSVLPVAKSVRVIRLPGLPLKGDVTDWQEAGNSKAGLLALVAQQVPERPTPIIKIVPGELDRMADEAEDAFINAAVPIYVTGAGLVKVAKEQTQATNGAVVDAARTIPLSEDSLIDFLSRCSEWQKYDLKQKAWKRAHPDRNAAKILLSRDGEWRSPKLRGILTAPTLRPDGSVLLNPGYDQATGLYLASNLDLSSHPQNPSRSDAEAALTLLEGLLNGFPFASPASRSVALSALISPVVRGAIPQMPLHAVRAPTAGTGKSYLIDLASAIVSGHRAPVISAGSGEETDKRLGSALLGNPALLSIDNVNGQLGSDVLCQMVERPLIEIRPLGKSTLIKIESHCSVFATGNNIQLVEDMNRRTVLCSLDANMERPETRSFADSPFDLILKDRAKYVSAALTVVQAYISVGKPNSRRNLASFEDWSALVRSALIWLGKDDPCETMEDNRQNDPSVERLSNLVDAWQKRIGLNRPMTAAELKAEASSSEANTLDDPFYEALRAIAATKTHAIDPQRLGTFLSQNEGKVSNGLKIIKQGKSTKKWSLTKIN
ncbi:hypothetical protein [Roseibium suaedae]|uniref:Putative DNA primase/helicase n=1 Tax=Roseibium suaedae TaxID=735517 RepID=A0A1M6ZK90_9HYPH|nr:hypothetical protein [Roseibium suaedae]SHL30906.1 putative DNA primase/helicase [Roseibium suaedae]